MHCNVRKGTDDSMRIAILSDIHADDSALRAAVTDARSRAADAVVCLGDLVGYHSHPGETLALMRDQRIRAVHGNHDLMATGALPTTDCGPLARQAIRWTRRQLDNADIRYLRELPRHLYRDGMLCCHSVPWSCTVRLESMEDIRSATHRLRRMYPGIRVFATGHTHVPRMCAISHNGEVTGYEIGAAPMAFPPDTLILINPGSVGLPRDGLPDAAYAIADLTNESVQFVRVEYDRSALARDDARVGLDAAMSLRRAIASSRIAAAVSTLISGGRKQSR